MTIIIISGFLGSGKTTLLLAFAKAFSENGKRLAIIENEVGEVGVDDSVLKEEGLDVKEIYSGCICCSLRMDLVAALLEIERDYNPDVVILEPSGVAGPKQVLNALTGYGGEIESKLLLSVIDASRFEAIQDMSIPLVTDGIEIADLILINKADLLSENALSHITETIRSIRNDADLFTISARSGQGIDDVFKALDLPQRDVKSINTNKKEGPQPTVYSLTVDVRTSQVHKEISNEWCQHIDVLGANLKESGCQLIGHIKAIIKSERGGYLVISKTEFEQSAQTKGRLPTSLTSLTITLNVIVYGIGKQAVKQAVNALNLKQH